MRSHFYTSGLLKNLNFRVYFFKKNLCKTFALATFFAGIIPSSGLAQFGGGSNDGVSTGFSSNQNLGRNIFTGGVNDGNSVAVASSQNLGRNIFLGGVNDGNMAAFAASQGLGRNIYVGGINDGNNVAIASSQNLGRNIFTGGINDGNNVAIASSQNLGRNIFLGGANDGWAMAFAANVYLPITLLDFNGKWLNENALLSWKTATEVNASHFILERSLDGNNFTAITNIKATGESNTERNYTYTDAEIKTLIVTSGTVYYRLKPVDKNGEFTYSGIVILKANSSSAVQYAVFPNPAKEFITISTTGPIPINSMLRLADISGKILMQERIRSAKQQFSVSRLLSGTYFLQVLAADKVSYTQKIIIKK